MADETNVSLFERTADVQARQALVMSRGLRDAWSDGFDWMLQLDIDELLYFPRESEREDARAFFGGVPVDIDALAFHNHEVLPCSSSSILPPPT